MKTVPREKGLFHYNDISPVQICLFLRKLASSHLPTSQKLSFLQLSGIDRSPHSKPAEELGGFLSQHARSQKSGAHPGSQAAGWPPTYQLRFSGCKQHLTLGHKQDVRGQKSAQGMGTSENWAWKQDQNLVSTQQGISML